MIPYADLLKVRCPKREFEWDDRQVLLYALSTGFGQDPLCADELPFVYERQLKIAPSFVTVAAWGSNPSLAEAGVDYRHVVHAEQGVELHRPIPPSGRVRASGGITAAVDKGDKGALICAETVLADAGTGEPYATLTTTWFARADGHFGGPSTGGPSPSPPPDRAPDLTRDYTTSPSQALIYRLLGDRNPLHVDPQVACKAGFDRPILHGLCTYGVTCRAVLELFAAYDPERIVSHRLRFSAPVLPGETLSIDFWRDGNLIAFQARAKERDTLVVTHGRTLLHA